MIMFTIMFVGCLVFGYHIDKESNRIRTNKENLKQQEVLK